MDPSMLATRPLLEIAVDEGHPPADRGQPVRAVPRDGHDVADAEALDNNRTAGRLISLVREDRSPGARVGYVVPDPDRRHPTAAPPTNCPS